MQQARKRRYSSPHNGNVTHLSSSAISAFIKKSLSGKLSSIFQPISTDNPATLSTPLVTSVYKSRRVSYSSEPYLVVKYRVHQTFTVSLTLTLVKINHFIDPWVSSHHNSKSQQSTTTNKDD